MTDENSEAMLRRRWMRWLTLGEILGVAALIISGLTFWNSYSERRHSETSRIADERQARTKARILILKAEREKDGDRLTLAAAGDQVIQGQTIAFPKALHLDPIDSTDPRIEASWFASGLKKALKAAGEDDDVHGDARLPVAITTRFTTGGDLAENVALYDIGYVTESSLLGTSIKLRGLSLIGRSDPRTAPSRLDALWSKRHQAKK